MTPTHDWEAKIKEIVTLARKQNWKNGGVHEYDSDEVEELLVEVVRTEIEAAEKRGEDRERTKHRFPCERCNGEGTYKSFDEDGMFCEEQCVGCKGAGVFIPRPITPTNTV